MAAKETIDIEGLVEWTYRRQKAHLVGGLGGGLFSREAFLYGTTSMTNVCMDIGRLGCMVDTSLPDPRRLAEDAERVHEAVCHTSNPGQALLVHFAKTAARPPWGEGLRSRLVPAWRRGPVYNFDGKPAKGSFHLLWDRNRNEIGCSLRLVNAPDYVAAIRATYGIWHRALEGVYGTIMDRGLIRHQLTTFAVPAAPWRHGS